MRRRRLRKTLILAASGGCLWLSCPAGLGSFLAPIIQPILGQVLSEVAVSFTDQLLNQTNTP